MDVGTEIPRTSIRYRRPPGQLPLCARVVADGAMDLTPSVPRRTSVPGRGIPRSPPGGPRPRRLKPKESDIAECRRCSARRGSERRWCDPRLDPAAGIRGLIRQGCWCATRPHTKIIRPHGPSQPVIASASIDVLAQKLGYGIPRGCYHRTGASRGGLLLWGNLACSVALVAVVGAMAASAAIVLAMALAAACSLAAQLQTLTRFRRPRRRQQAGRTGLCCPRRRAGRWRRLACCSSRTAGRSRPGAPRTARSRSLTRRTGASPK